MAKNIYRVNRTGDRDLSIAGDHKPSFSLPPAPPKVIFNEKDDWTTDKTQVVVGNYSYIPERVDYTEDGIWTYWVGTKFPSRGFNPEEAVFNIQGAKRFLMRSFQLLNSPLVVYFALKPEKAINYFTDVIDMMPGVKRWRLKPEYYSAPAKEARKFVEIMLESLGINGEKIGEIVCQMLEFDHAYRWRFQDIMTYANKEAMIKNAPKEIKRLLTIEKSHEPHQDVQEKFQKIAKLIDWAWRIPKYKKALKKAFEEIDFERCKLDETDVYHTILYSGYNVLGRSLEQRLALYESYHGADRDLWPPRMTIENKI